MSKKKIAIGGSLGALVIGGTGAVIAFLGATVVLIAMIITSMVGGASTVFNQPSSAASCGTGGLGGDGGSPVEGTQEQYVRTMIGIAKTMNVPKRGQIIATMVMLQESTLRNYANDGQNVNGYTGFPAPGTDFWLGVAKLSMKYPHDAVGHDADSVGLFQQRASAGWADDASFQAIDDPEAAIRRLLDPRWGSQQFFGGPGGSPNRGLLDINGWQGMSLTQAAQTVQGSAWPLAYAKWEAQATSLVDANQDAPALPLLDPAGAGAGGDAPSADGCTGALRGLLSRDNLALKSASEREMRLAGFAAEFSWDLLEPTEGNYNLEPIAKTVAWSNANGKRFRLRVFAGDEAPQYAKEIGGAPLKVYNHDTNRDVTVGRFWLPEYQARYAALMSEIASQFDGDPAMAEVNVCGGGFISCELGLLMLSDKNSQGKTNQQVLTGAGLTDENREAMVRNDIAMMQSTFATTWVTLWLHAWQEPSGGASLNKAMDIGDAAYAASPQTTLGHTGADETTVIGHNSPWPLYDHFLSGGMPWTLQTRSLRGGYDGNHGLGDLSKVVDWSAKNGVLAVELPRGWESHLTDEEVDAANGLMGANGPTGPTGDAAAIIAAAQRWIGTPYSWGGGTVDGPSEGFAQGAGIIGFDCSSLVQYAVYNGLGRSPSALLPRVAQAQFEATKGNLVPVSQLQPGDLLYWGNSLNLHHTAIYIGGGKMIEAARTGTLVRMVPARLTGDYYGATRLNIQEP